MGVFTKLVSDKRLNDIIERLEQAETEGPPIDIEGQMMAVCGYDRKTDEMRLMFYDTKLSPRGLQELRPKFNGRLVAHRYLSAEYMCFTDIQDEEPPENKGKWVIEGVGKTGAVRQVFDTREAMIVGRDEVYKQIKGRAFVHHIGTTTYHIINVEFYMVLQKEKQT